MVSQKIHLTETDLHNIIKESVRTVLYEMENNKVLNIAKEHGIKCDGMGATSPAINNKGEFMKVYKSKNGFALCIQGKNGTRPIPPTAWQSIGITSNGTGLTLEEAVRIMLKIGDYYRLF